jgi:hypothetical protein
VCVCVGQLLWDRADSLTDKKLDLQAEKHTLIK